MNYREFLEQRRERIAQGVQEGYRTLAAEEFETTLGFPLSIEDIVGKGESSEVEFKST